MRLLLASSNAGKLLEYRILAEGRDVTLELLPEFSELPPFAESAPTLAENAAGKALHYGRFSRNLVFADDSGLFVPALGGAPGVHSARYAGADATDADRLRKLLAEMRGKKGGERRARFVCVIALAQRGCAIAIFSDSVEGFFAEELHGKDGFGYDPVFVFPPLDRTFAEISREEKNRVSHRGKAFRKLLDFLESPDSPALT